MTYVPSKRIRLRYILAIAYVFDELINWSLPNNISGTIALITLAFLVILNRPNRLLLSTYDLGFIFIICLASGIAFASDLGCGAESKGILSLALIVFLVLSMRIFSPSLLVLDKAVSRFILFSITILLLLAAAKLSLFQVLYDSSRLSDPYSEPSHVALYLLPVLSYRLLNNIQDPWSWLSIVTATLVAPSTTLLVGVTVLLVAYLISIRLSSRKIIPILAVAALSILLVTTNKWDTSHHIDRISGIIQANNSSVTNNSSLIWLNGWSQAYETFVATYGMGTGFNQMGCGRFAYVGEFSYQLLIGTGKILNTENGSFTAAKIISEMGIMGVLITLFLTLLSAKSVINLRQLRTLNRSKAQTPAWAAALQARAAGGLCILVFLFVRNPGYFQLPLITALSLLFLPIGLKNERIAAIFGVNAVSYAAKP